MLDVTELHSDEPASLQKASEFVKGLQERREKDPRSEKAERSQQVAQGRP